MDNLKLTKFKDDEFKLASDVDIFLKGCYNKKNKVYDYLNLEIGGTTHKISTEELRTILFLLSDEENRKKLQDLRIDNVHHFDYTVAIKATKDIKKDEIIKANLKLEVSDFKLDSLLRVLVSTNGKDKAIEIINNLDLSRDKLE